MPRIDQLNKCVGFLLARHLLQIVANAARRLGGIHDDVRAVAARDGPSFARARHADRVIGGSGG